MNHMLRSGRAASRALYLTTKNRLKRGPQLPSWSFSFEVIVTMLREDWRTLWSLEPAALRAYLDSLPGAADMVRRCQRRAEVIGGVAGEWFFPPGADVGGPALLYFHGGSYIFGSLKTHGDVIARYALASGLPVFAPLYRLAPEHPWPAQLEDAQAVFQALSPRRVAIAGESAGGHLVLSLAAEQQKNGGPSPVAMVAISPWLDLEAKSDSYQRHAAYDYGTREMLLAQAKLVAGPNPTSSVSLIARELGELGPLLIQAGGAELLFDEVEGFAKARRAAGFQTELDILPEMPHAASNLAAYCPAGAEAIVRACAFLKKHL